MLYFPRSANLGIGMVFLTLYIWSCYHKWYINFCVFSCMGLLMCTINPHLWVLFCFVFNTKKQSKKKDNVNKKEILGLGKR